MFLCEGSWVERMDKSEAKSSSGGEKADLAGNRKTELNQDDGESEVTLSTLEDGEISEEEGQLLSDVRYAYYSVHIQKPRISMKKVLLAIFPRDERKHFGASKTLKYDFLQYLL